MSKRGDPTTRGDLDDLGTDLRGEMQTMGTEIRGEMKTMGAEIRGEMQTMRAELRDEIHWLGARFEQLDSKVSAFGEALMGLREHVTVEMRAVRAELGTRIDDLERAMNGGFASVHVDVAELRKRFDRYEDNSELEKRVAAIEAQLRIAQKP